MMEWLKKYDILLKTLCALIAVMLWLYVTSTENPETETSFRSVKVQLQNKDQLLSDYGLSVLSGDSATISVRVKGLRPKLAQIGDDSAIIATADLAAITTPGAHRLYYKIELPIDGVEIVSRDPTFITVTTAKFVTTTVPVRAKMSGSAPSGYHYGEYKLSPSSIVLEGPEEDIARVVAAQVAIDANGLTESGNWALPYMLVDENGEEVKSVYIKKADEIIMVTMGVTRSKQVPLVVDLISAPGVDKMYASVAISPSYVTVTGESDALATLNQLNIGSIDLATAQSGDVTTFPVVLPNGILGIDGATQARATVTLSGISSGTYRVDRFEIGVPEGVHARILDQSITIVLKGHESVMSAITSSNILLKAELTPETTGEDGLVPGVYTVPAEVVIAGSPPVAPFGNYTLEIEIYDEEDGE